MFIKKIALAFTVFAFSINIFAQNSDEAVKEKIEREAKLLEQILADAKNLRLPENRAMVFAKVGSALWKADEKQARKLFQDAVDEIVAAQADAQNEKNGKQYFQALIYGQTPRIDIINLIAARDAELALDFLTKSRPAVISEAMKNTEDDGSSNILQYARNEIAAEQRLIGLTAEQNPEAAIKRVRESVKKGISYETFNLLKKIYVKDAATADKLTAEVAESFLGENFSKNYQTMETVGYFVAEMGRVRGADEKYPKISDELLRRLITKMTDVWVDSKNNQFAGYWSSKTVIEKLLPERAAKIAQRVEENNRRYQTDESLEYSKLMSSEVPAEEMLAKAEKLPPSYRNEIYRNAANKIAQSGNIAQAERILQTNLSGEQSEYYLSQFYQNLAYQKAGEGKFDEAQTYANQISEENQRINVLIYLGNTVFQKNPQENKSLAQRILNDAQRLISDAPETQNDLNSAAYLATVYAPIDADESFRLIESMLPMLDELIQANVVLMKFRSYGGFRQSEIQFSGVGNVGVYNLDGALRVLKEKDFKRTAQFAGNFNRLEWRIWLQMQLIDESLSIVNLPINSRGIIIKSQF